MRMKCLRALIFSIIFFFSVQVTAHIKQTISPKPQLSYDLSIEKIFLENGLISVTIKNIGPGEVTSAAYQSGRLVVKSVLFQTSWPLAKADPRNLLNSRAKQLTFKTNLRLKQKETITFYLENFPGDLSGGRKKMTQLLTPPLPDLVIRNFSVDPAVPNIGEKISLGAELANQGEEAVIPGGTTSWDIRINGVVASSSVSNSSRTLKAGEAIRIGLFGPPGPPQGPFPAPGTYNLEIVADPENKIVESDENNNGLKATITLKGGAPDLIISKIVTDPANPTVDKPFYFVVTILNQGEVSISKDGDYLNSDCPGLSAGISNHVLKPGETYVIRLFAQSEMHVPGTRTCTFKVLGNNYELKTDNNTYKFTFTVSQ